MSVTDEKGVSRKAHLEQVKRQTKREIKDLDGPEFPQRLSHVWSAFICLSKRRQVSVEGPLPISYLEIRAFMEVTGTPLKAWEVEVICDLDELFMKEIRNG